MKELKSVSCGFGHATNGTSLIAVFGSRVRMDELATYLSRFGDFDRPIIDRTRLSGEFDLKVFSSADIPAASSEALFIIALREQLGLTLRAEQGAVDVLRIQHIERPSED